MSERQADVVMIGGGYIGLELGTVYAALGSRVVLFEMATKGKQIRVVSETGGIRREDRFDRVLAAVGRRPACDDVGLENTRAQQDERGFIVVDVQQRTAEPGIFAIGDAAGGLLLAHNGVPDP